MDDENTKRSSDTPEPTRLGGEPAGTEDPSPSGAGDRTVAGWAEQPEEGGTSRSDDRIGPYKLLRLLGEGGMGAVYLAEQTSPIKRQVALKLTRGTVHTERALRRFEAERQALALMNHPHIAQVYDAGSTDRGEPYFVMEHVEGLPITGYCDHRQLTIRQRLELFIQVCEGVQHAHQKGIIHRDLKPSNVLVAGNGQPLPKIIDFGIAKAIDEPLTDKTLLTREGGVLGTPAYMSPERIKPEGDVDTRADIYSLGVLLYELLTGRLPYAVQSDSYYEAAERVLTAEVTRPSGQLTTLEFELLEDVARQRSTDSSGLKRRLKGDLDWITLMAMARERERRYPSAAELAADVRRHLAGEPVLAGPPGVGYRMGKFVRRHWMGVTAAALVAATLVAGIVGTTIQAERANREAARANREAETARQVSDFLVGLFEVSDPSEARGETITAKEILDRGADRIDQELADQPLVRAQMLFTIGSVYSKLALYDRSEQLLRQSLDLRRPHLDLGRSELGETERSLAWLLYLQGRYDEAEAMAAGSLSAREKVLGPDDPELAKTIEVLAVVRRELGRLAEAESLLERSCELSRRHFGAETEEYASCLNELAMVYERQQQIDRAEQTMESVVAIYERLFGPDDPLLTASLNNLAGVYTQTGRLDEAETIYLRVLDNTKRLLGDEHPQLAAILNNLAGVYLTRGRLDEAESTQLQALAIGEAAVGPDHPYLWLGRSRLAEIYHRQGRYDEARSLYRRAIESWQETLGPQHPWIARNLFSLAELCLDEGRSEEAAQHLERGLPIVMQSDLDRSELMQMLGNLAEGFRSAGREDFASELESRAAKLSDDFAAEREPATGL